MKLHPKRELRAILKSELPTLILELLRKIAWAEHECRKLEKELPLLLRERLQKIIHTLETLVKEGEKKMDSLLGEKITPLLDLVERWLKKATQTTHQKLKSHPKTSRKAKRNPGKHKPSPSKAGQ